MRARGQLAVVVGVVFAIDSDNLDKPRLIDGSAGHDAAEQPGPQEISPVEVDALRSDLARFDLC